jgi:hypothetical protein
MITVDEASILSALFASSTSALLFARTAWAGRNQSAQTYAIAIATFRSKAILGFVALAPAVMIASALVFHALLAGRYSHGAPYRWIGAIVGFMFLGVIVAGVGSLLLSLGTRKS